jgi:hypothetical protein
MDAPRSVDGVMRCAKDTLDSGLIFFLSLVLF